MEAKGFCLSSELSFESAEGCAENFTCKLVPNCENCTMH